MRSPLLNGLFVNLGAGASCKYDIEDDGWSGRLWSKTECDDNVHNCEIGQSIATKVEFFFPPFESRLAFYYNIRLVDGYSLIAEIIPYAEVLLS